MNKLIELLGRDTDQWVGQRIAVYPVDISYNGQSYSSVAITSATPAEAKSSLVEVSAEEDDGDILFGKR